MVQYLSAWSIQEPKMDMNQTSFALVSSRSNLLVKPSWLFQRNTRPSHPDPGFSQEISAPGIQTQAFLENIQAQPFLEKNAPRSSKPNLFSRKMRPSHPNPGFSRETCAPLIQTHAVLKKNKPWPSKPRISSRNTRHAIHSQLFLEKYAIH